MTPTHLDVLEAEAIHIIREVAAELERPVLLFSGGKDSIVLLRLAEKAFRPAPIPFPVMHVDTGHNFSEVIAFRDRRAAELGVRLIVASVQDSIDAGRAVEERGPRASRNRLQTVTLLDAIERHGFDAAFGGARRDEERARAKERIMSFRDDFGQWDPRAQRPELWNLYNGRVRRGEHLRAFPISNWTELDVWQYVAQEQLELPTIYFAHERAVFERDGMLYAVSDHVELLDGEAPFVESVRYRTVGDLTVTGAVRSTAVTIDAVVEEIAATRVTERGQTRGDDRVSVASMEDRKRDGVLLMDLLRLATAGSVDDGKSTLIGRLLHDAKGLMADEVEAAGGDLARLTDGLRAEREQGITIDVAYRHFATPRRRFILADCPGHAQYTRNMVTGASTAELAIVLVDARHGVTEQTRRHAAITALLGVRHVTVCVNKMDLVGYSEERFDAIVRDFCELAAHLGLRDAVYIPISALEGDNVVDLSGRTPWYLGPPLLEHLETVPVGADPTAAPARFPVQTVIRPQASDYRGYAGAVASGVLRVGDEVVVLPRGQRTRIEAIDGPHGPLAEAEAPLSVTVRLTDDVDVARGDVLAPAGAAPEPVRDLRATICWLSEQPARPGGRYLVKHATRTVRGRLEAVDHRLDVATLAHEPAPTLALNDIARVALRLAEPLPIDRYADLRPTGAFILVDESTNDTVAAGMAA